MIEYILIIPVLTALLCYLLEKRIWVEMVSTAGSSLTLLVSTILALEIFSNGPRDEGLLYMDAFSAYMLLLISFVGFASALYSLSYIGREHDEGKIGIKRIRLYYGFFHVFVFTMVLVCVSNNLGVMWIAIEGTTLASAYLVSFYDKETSIEAAWKYIIICSVGITLALLGTILIYASAVISSQGEVADALNWSTLVQTAGQLNPDLLKIAFILVLVGYGTKVGLAPMHTWLPDAHSEAPTPISALLSGVLLNCAMYGILRYHIIISNSSVGARFSSTLLLVFGIISLLTAAAFIIMQRDYKRLLAYSSIEHMGIIAIGFGFGGTLGIFGALLHMLNHALTKSLMFFGAGNIFQKWRTKEIDKVRGMSSTMPMTATLFLAGALAITGSPPFSVFLSEFTILVAGLSAANYLGVAIYLFLIVVIFAAFMYHVGKMVFGEPSDSIPKGESPRGRLALMSVLLIAILAIGLFLPSQLTDGLNAIVSIFTGGRA